jgi:hypothetical protein
MMDRVAAGPLFRIMRQAVVGEAGEGEREVEVLVAVVANAILQPLEQSANIVYFVTQKRVCRITLTTLLRLLPYTCTIMAFTRQRKLFGPKATVIVERD